MTVRAVTAPDITRATGVAEPYTSATVSTKLMGTVTGVHVREGDHVASGQPLVSIDARELTAKSSQIAAAIAEAEAMEREATTHAQRMRTLFAEDAAPRAQLDAAETALARARAGVHAARAGNAELEATRGYSVVKAPFSGIITRRMVDPGAFASPGAPLIALQDSRRLRVTGTAAPGSIQSLKRGTPIDMEIEGQPATGIVEAIVPTGGSLYRINVIVDNRAGAFLPGAAATLMLPQANTRAAIRIPRTALIENGDLTGVYVRRNAQTMLRWIQTGSETEVDVEVLSGLRDGEQIIIPAAMRERPE
ncbi:MAG TPA: efflux RND transporter periplasmic adaptor subunit [Longimicrobiales bacterium]